MDIFRLSKITLCSQNTEGVTFVLVYVDDLLIKGDHESEIHQMKDDLNRTFTIKDLGEMKYFLGIEVARNTKEIMFNQRSIIGRLLYLNLTRPNISYSVQSQFMTETRKQTSFSSSNSSYLSGTINQGLYNPANSELKLIGLCDSGWSNCAFSARSLTGYCVFLVKSLISWKTKKQKTVSKSSTEAEHRCMSQTTSELVWLEGLLSYLGISIPAPIDLLCDNKSAIYLAHNPIFHERTKHLKVDCHYVREHLAKGFLNVLHVTYFLQLAHIMTKCRNEQQHKHLSFKLGLFSTCPT